MQWRIHQVSLDLIFSFLGDDLSNDRPVETIFRQDYPLSPASKFECDSTLSLFLSRRLA